MRTLATKTFPLLMLIALVAGLSSPLLALAGADFQGKKILVVMSYDDDSTMEVELKQTFDALLSGATLKYHQLNAKKDLAGARQKAAEAYRLFQDFAPDAVIAANDDAQELFVVPYLKNKVSTPVVFTGVNDDASKYGFPADNVTGVLEKKHYREGIRFAQLIDPRIHKVGLLYPDTLSQRKNVEQIEREKASYGVEISDIRQVATVEEMRSALRELSEKTDALLVLNPVGIRDKKGAAVSENALYKIIMETSDKPTIGVNEWEIREGILCGVLKLNTEQASLTVGLLDKILAGQPVKEVPITENHNGSRCLNVLTLKRLGIKLDPKVLIGTEIVSRPSAH